MHHVMTDGYGIAAFLANIMDEYDENSLPHLRILKWWEKILIFLAIPYHAYGLNAKFTPYPKDDNPFTNVKPENCGVKRGAFAKEYSVDAIKKKSKQHGVTINDLIMTAISMTVKQYFLAKGDEKADHILLFIPFNLREKPRNRLDFSFVNQLSVFPVILPLVNDFKSGVQAVARTFTPIKDSFVTFAMYYLVQMGQILPMKIQMDGFLVYANKTSILTTNVRGPSQPYVLARAKSVKVATFMPNLVDIAGGFAVVSH
jgi:WS/DGAT C-terminal domain